MPIRLTADYVTRFADERLPRKGGLKRDLIDVVTIFSRLRKLGATSQSRADLRLLVLEVINQGQSSAHRLLSNDPQSIFGGGEMLNPQEKFLLIHFVSVCAAWCQALVTAGSTFSPVIKDVEEPDEKRIKREHSRNAGIADLIEQASKAELSFSFAVTPTEEMKPFLGSYTKTYLNLVTFLGGKWEAEYQIATECLNEAIKQYEAWATSGIKSAVWVGEFLNYKHQQAARTKVPEDVESVNQALTNWLGPSPSTTDRRAAAWRRYRDSLAILPDDKSTMFDESFGVRNVFVQPLASYKVVGTRRDDGAVIPDVANLIATLLSDRAAVDDLILLCGGPGSGKSTLCRILASELARNEQVHPVFLRLRRLQDGQDIIGFLEDHLQKETVIDKISDLASLPNLTIILDGFDELVMASRTRLREFFNALKDDVTSGPLRKAKTIVSGRDTLFPNGAGLPIGAHVISLMPFDKPRIETWGRKWRSLHSGREVAEFHPENFLSEAGPRDRRAIPPLHHLVSWPLTLHLVARAHTSGSIDLSTANSSEVEKAILYRSIVDDAALRV